MKPNTYNVTSASQEIVLAAANVQATERIITNGLTSPILYLAYGSSAGPNLFTAALNPGDILTTAYNGMISGYWSGTGTAFITEVSA